MEDSVDGPSLKSVLKKCDDTRAKLYVKDFFNHKFI